MFECFNLNSCKLFNSSVSSCRLRVLRGERQGEHQRAAGVRAPGGHHLCEDVRARGRGGAGGSGHQDHQTDRQTCPATSEVLLIVGRRSSLCCRLVRSPELSRKR